MKCNSAPDCAGDLLIIDRSIGLETGTQGRRADSLYLEKPIIGSDLSIVQAAGSS